jgi:hypothetical protein
MAMLDVTLVGAIRDPKAMRFKMASFSHHGGLTIGNTIIATLEQALIMPEPTLRPTTPQ